MGEAVDFVAYFPYCSDITSDSIYPINLSSQTNMQEIDIIYSNNAKYILKSEGKLNLTLIHPLSKLVIYSSAGKGLKTSDLEGMNIELSGVYSQALFHLRNGLIEPLGEKTTIRMLTDPLGYQSKAILLPVSSKEISISVKLANGNEYHASLSEIPSFESQKIYSINLTINRTNIEVSSSGIAGWQGVEDDIH